MSQPGLGAMIHYLRGGSEHAVEEYVGKTIKAARIDYGSIQEGERLQIDFEDGPNIDIWDNGQSCCESRYMTTDDDIQSLVGGKLLHIVEKAGNDEEDSSGEYHETAFIEVATDKGFITICNHNEHNGYYGGFGLTITERTWKKAIKNND